MHLSYSNQARAFAIGSYASRRAIGPWLDEHACFPLSLYLSTRQCMSTWHATEGNVQQGK